MKSAAISAMQAAIIRYIQAKLPKDNNRAFFGTVQGNRVVIGNHSYRYDPTVDLNFGYGSKVACILPNSGNTAAIVGVV